MNNESKTQFTLRLPNELKALIENKTKTLGVSINSFIINALWQATK